MNKTEMPEWFENIITDEDSEELSVMEIQEKIWQFMSRPENLAKIAEVKALIEACNNSSDYSLQMIKAIEPFEEGGSDE